MSKLKYLDFIWTDKIMSIKPTVWTTVWRKSRETLTKLKWMKRGKRISTPVLRKCFFTYVFPHLAGILKSFYLLLPKMDRLRVTCKKKQKGNES